MCGGEGIPPVAVTPKSLIIGNLYISMEREPLPSPFPTRAPFVSLLHRLLVSVDPITAGLSKSFHLSPLLFSQQSSLRGSKVLNFDCNFDYQEGLKTNEQTKTTCLGLSPRDSDVIGLESDFVFLNTPADFPLQSRLRTPALGYLSTVVASTFHLWTSLNSPCNPELTIHHFIILPLAFPPISLPCFPEPIS